jgi:hypothetical protein
VFGWTRLETGHPWRRRWMAIGAVCALAIVALTPSQVSRLRSLHSALHIQQQILADLKDMTESAAFTQGCRPVAVPNHRPIPHVALWSGIRPKQIVSAQLEQPTTGLYIDPANARVERNFTLDPNDPKKLTAKVPPGFTRVAANRSWVLYARCA